MSNLRELEREIEKLPHRDFELLVHWINHREEHFPASDRSGTHDDLIRDHSAFLKGYSPSDEGLYDDAAAR
jgi:hypothetical protein